MKKQLKCLFFLSLISFSFAAEPGGWLDKWLTIDSGLLLWTILTFFVLLFILRWKAWGPLMNALEDRAKQIEASLRKAEKLTVETDKRAEKNEKILNEARKEAQEIISKAREDGEKLKVKLESDGQEKQSAMLIKAKEQINAEKKQALSEIKQVVVDLTINASEKIIKRNLNTEDNKEMIKNTVDKLKQTNE